MSNNVQLVLFFDLQHFQKHFLPLFGSSLVFFFLFSRVYRTRHGRKIRMLSDLRINGILTMSIYIRQLEIRKEKKKRVHTYVAWLEQFLKNIKKKIRQRITKEHKQHHHDEIKDH